MIKLKYLIFSTMNSINVYFKSVGFKYTLKIKPNYTPNKQCSLLKRINYALFYFLHISKFAL